MGQVGKPARVIGGVGHGLHLERAGSPVLIDAERVGHRHHPFHRARNHVGEDVEHADQSQRRPEHRLDRRRSGDQPDEQNERSPCNQGVHGVAQPLGHLDNSTDLARIRCNGDPLASVWLRTLRP